MKYLSRGIYVSLALLTIFVPMIFVKAGNLVMAEAILLAWPAIVLAFVFASLSDSLSWRTRLRFRLVALAFGLAFYVIWGASTVAGFSPGVIIGALLLIIAFAAEQLRDVVSVV